ncbi:MAG TPA: nickel pincer cofactor biosynthesis protein LarC [Bacteroidales bacterium]|nr:nickel pincer cofactor biosynthesis protein LarC [Bacteroidales bacterium]
MKILYYDCFAGISGDMNLGALIDLGVDIAWFKSELDKLPVHGYEFIVTRDIRKGISGTRVQVLPDQEHSQMHGHHHHDHGHGEHHHHHSWKEIREMIERSKLGPEVKELSIRIFSKVAQAEAKIHNKSVEEVQFHEVGAIDSIVDIVGAALCLNFLGPDEIQCSTVELGGGTVNCAHGIYPVPAPATAEILSGIPIRKGTVDYEATTPTGAAILAACVNKFTDKTDFRILKTGYGIGTKDSTIPNVLRTFMCDSSGADETETVPSFIVECNIDDMNPEFYDYIIDSLFSAGAKDVFITPIIMKKSRPAVKLSVLCTPEAENRVNEVLFRETSTIGVRKYTIDKTMLERKTEHVTTRFGEVRVKSAFFQGVCIKSKPEYDDCIKIAREKKIPVSHVYQEVEKALTKHRDANEPA